MNNNLGEFKVVTLRECPVADDLIDNADKIDSYLKANIPGASWYDPCKEAFVVIHLDTRRKAIGFNLVALGGLDCIYIHPREVFRAAIVACAHSIVIAHNHPSGATDPSTADIKVTQELIRAGQLLKIEVLDHIIWNEKSKRTSLRELGYFYT